MRTTTTALALLLPTVLMAQTALNPPGWYNYNPANSPLTDNKIGIVRASPDGSIWVGCSQTGGLVQIRMDDEWRFWNTANGGLQSNLVYALAIDTINFDTPVAWVSCGVGGLYRIKGNNVTKYRTSNSGIQDNEVYGIHVSNQGPVWLTTQNGFDRFDTDSTWTNFNETNLPGILEWQDTWEGYNCRILAHDSILWLTKRFYHNNEYHWGIFTMNLVNGNWTQHTDLPFDLISMGNIYPYTNGINFTALGDDDNLNGSYIKAMLTYHQGEWSYLDRFNSDIPGYPYDYCTDQHGNLWMTCDYGITKFDGENFTNWHPYNSPLPEDLKTLSSIAVDKEDRVWIATTAHGLFMFDQREYESYINSLTDAALEAAMVVPNPSGGVFALRFGKPVTSATVVEVLDMAGRVLEKHAVAPGTAQMEVGADLPTGIFTLKLSSSGGSRGMRVVKL